MRHNPAYGIMTELMQRGPVPIDRLEIGLRRRDLHIVFSRCIECAIAANMERDAGGLDQRLDRGLDQARRRWWRGGGDVRGQTVALVGIEDRKAFEKWNRLRFLAGFGSTSLFV